MTPEQQDQQPGQSTSEPEPGRLPRGVCPECHREVALRRHGELREHEDGAGYKCPASGETIAEAEVIIERSVEDFRRGVLGRSR